MDNFSLSGKSNHVFRILQIKQEYQTEVEYGTDKQGYITLDMLFAQIPTENQPHEIKAHKCICNPDCSCDVPKDMPCTSWEWTCPLYKPDIRFIDPRD